MHRWIAAVWLGGLGCADPSAPLTDEAPPEVTPTDSAAPEPPPPPPGGFAEPLPDCTEPGVCGCADCPTVLDDEGEPFIDPIVIVTPTRTISGQVIGGAGAGRFWVSNRIGLSFGGWIPKNDGDPSTFDLDLPFFCGGAMLKLLWSSTGDPFDEDTLGGTLIQLGRSGCTEPALRVGLAWDASDLQLHLVRPGGRINTDDDCTGAGCASGGPDWGVAGETGDDPRRYLAGGPLGPEGILLEGPEEGTYVVLVEHRGEATASASVGVHLRGTSTDMATLEALQPREVWTAATIEWPSGAVVPRSDVYDCAADWKDGCRAELPAEPR